ncbi:hypothetical protein ElyMa_001050400 [Elysia marginata]|uniref:DDE Tnp4 domain-containing protein n=1 Tax=Elysia marginata TaxID=1093978 RepID=A0AAV4HSW8_9GAST|nr:hypothetical protein ElyMa_001050400 [Elysia marginata]
MRPFPARGLDDRRRIYNYRLSRARRIVECAFGILAQRWAILKTTMKLQPDNAKKVVLACCILHNFVRRRNSESGDSASASTGNEEALEDAFQPQNVGERSISSTGRPTQETIEVRERFANLFTTSFAVSWQNERANVR